MVAGFTPYGGGRPMAGSGLTGGVEIRLMTKTPQITAEDFRRAVIIDFEGNMDRAPSLLGWRRQETTTHILLEQTLAPVIPPASIETLDLDEALNRLRSVAGDAHILGYSEHDLKIITTYCTDDELLDWFAAHYVNAKTLIDRWINRRVHAGEIDRPGAFDLKTSMGLIGMTYAVAAGPDTVGTTLRRLREYASKGRSHDELAPGIRRRWHRVLSHNATDLLATQALVRAALGVAADTPIRDQEATFHSRERHNAYSVPEWLMDAWLSGQNFTSRSDEQLFEEIAVREKRIMRARLIEESPSDPQAYWDWWFYASLLAIAGRRSASAALKASDSEYRALSESVQDAARRRWDEARAWRRQSAAQSDDREAPEQH